jgi:alkaline phosphatase D
MVRQDAVKTPGRRRFLQALAGMGTLELALPGPLAWAQVNSVDSADSRPRFAAEPFSLGIASGYPMPEGMVLWTRLAPQPAVPGGGMGRNAVEVRWEIAEDDAMRRIVASGAARAEAAWAHSVHVEARGLQPGRPYWYRFRAGDAESAIGRTRTAPAADAPLDRLRFAFASCQQYEQGYYGAYRHMVRDDPDLVVFLGDYIYEGSWGKEHVRAHQTPECKTLDEYRARHALYKGDADLQAAHAIAPWLVTWDDHEVENDYADDQPQNLNERRGFLARRAAAYKAYYEHMPLPRWAIPQGPRMQLYSRAAFGGLAAFHVLDDRQYRTPQACPQAQRGGSNTLDEAACPQLMEAGRTLLGAAQERWLEAGLADSRARWNIVAQQSVMAQVDRRPGEGRTAWTDSWDGYPRSRQRLLSHIADRKVANPVMIGGDVHMFYVNDLKADFDDPASPVIASEFVGTSITSQAGSQQTVRRYLPDNPHIRLAEARYRGYTRVELTPTRMRVDLRAMESVTTRDAACRTLASFVVEDGRPGPQKG